MVARSYVLEDPVPGLHVNTNMRHTSAARRGEGGEEKGDKEEKEDKEDKEDKKDKEEMEELESWRVGELGVRVGSVTLTWLAVEMRFCSMLPRRSRPLNPVQIRANSTMFSLV